MTEALATAAACRETSGAVPTDAAVSNGAGRTWHGDRRAVGLPVQQRHGGRAAPGRRALQLHGEPAARVRRRQPGGQAELLDLDEVLLRVAPYLHARRTSSVTTLPPPIQPPRGSSTRWTPQMEVATHALTYTPIRSGFPGIRICLLLPVWWSWCGHAPRSSSSRGRTCIGRKKKERAMDISTVSRPSPKGRSRDSDIIRSTSCSECSS